MTNLTTINSAVRNAPETAMNLASSQAGSNTLLSFKRRKAFGFFNPFTKRSARTHRMHYRFIVPM